MRGGRLRRACFLWYAFLPLLPSSLAQQALVSVVVVDGGLTRVEYTLPVAGNVSVLVSLIGEPDASYLILVEDEGGRPLAYEVNETLGIMEVACLNASQVRVSYYTQALTSKSGKVWTVNFTSPYRVKLTLPPNSTVIYFNQIPEEVAVEGGVLSLVFSPGTVVVKYVFTYLAPPKEELPQGSAEKEANATEKEATSPASTAGRGGAPPSAGVTLGYLALMAIAALAAALALASRLRRSSAPYHALDLSEEESEILETLKRMGGCAFQSELQRVLNIPATSLWRRLRRLSEKGYVVIEKRSGRNYVKLS